jgi:uncharacterized protein (DUF58 family)
MELDLPKEIFEVLDRLAMNPMVKSKDIYGGRHASPKFGSNPDFKEYRNYQSGDSRREIDWKAYMKSGKYLVRKREHQAKIDHWIIADGSGSMAFPIKGRSKYLYQLMLVGVLVHLFKGQGDSTGLVIEHELYPYFLTPQKTVSGITELLSKLYHFKPSEQSGFSNSIDTIKNKQTRPCVFWFITDFDCDPNDTLVKIKNLKEEGHDVRVIHLFQKEEKELAWRGECLFVDIEKIIDSAKLRPELLQEEYLKIYNEHCDIIKNNIEINEVPYHYLDIEGNLEEHIVEVLFGFEASKNVEVVN